MKTELDYAMERIRELESRPCPHVITSTDGTRHCGLAEGRIRELEGQLKRAREAIEKCESNSLHWLNRVRELEAENKRWREALEIFKQSSERVTDDLGDYLRNHQKRILELESLLRLAYPLCMDMQAAAAITNRQHGTDASLEAYERIRGICQQIQAALEDE